MTNTGLENEYRLLTADVGAVDVSALRSRVQLSGDDRHAFLHNFCSNDIRNLSEGGGCEAFLLNGKGTILFYSQVWRRPESLWIESGGGRGAALVAHLDRYLIREKVTLADRANETCEWVVAGPQSSERLSAALQTSLPTVLQSSVAWGDGFVVRTAWTATPNYTVIVPPAQVDDLRRRLTAAEIPPCDFAALDVLRIAAGFPLDGIDVTDKNLAQETARDERTLHFRKGCYLGQETVARLDALGHVNKTLVGVRFATTEAAPVPEPGAALTTPDGMAVGTLTSAARVPGGDAIVALAYVKQGPNAPGTAVAVGSLVGEVVKFD